MVNRKPKTLRVQNQSRNRTQVTTVTRRTGPVNPAVNTTISRVIQNPKSKNAGSAVKMSKIRNIATTQAGLDFLKCAFAEPDFQNMAPSGIPDGNLGRVLLHSHRSVTPMSTGTNDMYIVVPPIPGYSHFIHNGPPDPTSTFQGTAFSDASQLLDPDPMMNINNFRMVSNIVEVVPTMNDMTWQGSIEVYKIKVQISPTSKSFIVSGTSSDMGLAPTVYGLQGVGNNSAYDKFVAPFKHGAYSIALSTDPEFKMKAPVVLKDSGGNNSNVPDTTANQLPSYRYGYLLADGDYSILGTSEMETIVIKISGHSTAQSFVLRRWSCVEYSPAMSSTLYPYSRQSPPEDAVALSSYMYAARQIPIAVPYYQNAGFWDTFVNILRGATRVVGVVSGALSLLPGPAGVIASGVATVASGVSSVLR